MLEGARRGGGGQIRVSNPKNIISKWIDFGVFVRLTDKECKLYVLYETYFRRFYFENYSLLQQPLRIRYFL